MSQMSRTKRLLFVALHRPGRSPSQRFRFEQFLPFLQENGWQCDYAYMLDEQDDQADAWSPLFEQHGVQLVIESDAHLCKYTYPLLRSDAAGNTEGFIRDDDMTQSFPRYRCAKSWVCTVT